MKKLISLLLVLVLVLSLSTTAFAVVGSVTNGAVVRNGSITITNMVANNTYAIYKLLHLETYDVAAHKYNYTVEEKWADFFTTADALTYFNVENNYATWKAAEDDATVAAFAKKAMEYVKKVNSDEDPSNNIKPEKSSAVSGDLTPAGINAGKFEGLTLGYYLVDSSVGALCGLTTTNPHVNVAAKNAPPSIDKQVKEDSTDIFGYSNTAQIGQTVEFLTIINVHAGAENYVLHDTMTEGLTFNTVGKIIHVIPGVSKEDVPTEFYTVVTDDLTDGCDFEIRFTNHFTEHLSTNDKVEIYYTAIVNENAKIGDSGDVNKTWLDFGEGNKTTEKETITYTYGIDIVKTDDNDQLIEGAEFKIYDAETGGNEIAVVQSLTKTDANGNPVYRLATTGEAGQPIVASDGIVTVIGFDNGSYWLEETKAPATYQEISGRQKFIISDANLSVTYNNGKYVPTTGVQVVNKQGTKLPQTGATGTAMFIAFGMFTVLSTGVLLVTKKRMSMIEE